MTDRDVHGRFDRLENQLQRHDDRVEENVEKVRTTQERMVDAIDGLKIASEKMADAAERSAEAAERSAGAAEALARNGGFKLPKVSPRGWLIIAASALSFLASNCLGPEATHDLIHALLRAADHTSSANPQPHKEVDDAAR